MTTDLVGYRGPVFPEPPCPYAPLQRSGPCDETHGRLGAAGASNVAEALAASPLGHVTAGKVRSTPWGRRVQPIGPALGDRKLAVPHAVPDLALRGEPVERTQARARATGSPVCRTHSVGPACLRSRWPRTVTPLRFRPV